ncbi:MAG: hypothetical protein SF052_08915 [Bacteroidia bacterium]|nr:hypothetical protein [Bacteroidia bacterium]
MTRIEIKKTIAAAGISPTAIDNTQIFSHRPILGDVAVFEVLELGKHTRIQAEDKTLRYIFPGDYIMAAFGPRYASAQFEGYIPATPPEVYHILGQGGAIGVLASSHQLFEAVGPTSLRMVGYCTDAEGNVINSRYHRNAAQPQVTFPSAHPMRTILSIGSSMDSGKTTSAAYLASGLKKAGHTVAFIKITGTIYTKDADFVLDKGAHLSLDFSYFGYPSTYMVGLEELLSLYQNLRAKAATIHPDYIIVEIADGLIQQETAALLQSDFFRQSIDYVLFSCADSLGVIGGLAILESYGIRPFAISGLLTASPLMIEEVRKSVSLPVCKLSDLDDRAIARFFEPVAENHFILSEPQAI